MTDKNKNIAVDVHAVAETVVGDLETIEKQIERISAASKANAAAATFFKAAPQSVDAANKNQQLIGQAKAEVTTIKEEHAAQTIAVKAP